LAGRSEGRIGVMVVNCGAEQAADCIAALRLRGLRPGAKSLTVNRLDGDRRWCEDTLELRPVERREVCVAEDFSCQVYLPADSVAAVWLEDERAEPSAGWNAKEPARNG